MKSKNWIIISVLLITMLIISACNDNQSNTESQGSSSGSQNTSSQSNDEKIELTFWVHGTVGHTMEDIANEYAKDNPNIIPNVVHSDADTNANRLFNALSAGTGAPDVMLLEGGHLDRFREAKDGFNNLYDLGASNVKDIYLDWKWQISEDDDGEFVFGLPTDIGPKAMYYRADLFEQAGLPSDPDEVKSLISSKDKLKATAQTILSETNKPMLSSMEITYNMLLDGLQETYFNESGDLLIEKEGNGVKAAFDFAVEMNEGGYVGNYEFLSPEWSSAANNGEFVADIAAAWAKGFIETNAPDASGKWRVALLPEEFSGNNGGSFLVVPKQSKYPEEAYKFAEFMVNPENQLKVFIVDGVFPSIPEVYEMDEFKNIEDEYFGGQNTASVFAEAAKYIPEGVYKGPLYTSVHNEILTVLNNVQEGGNPDKEWEEAVIRIKRLIDR